MQQRPVGIRRSPAKRDGDAAAAGLANETGEYNCFLNAIIQCLWQCRAFRHNMLELDSDTLDDEEGSRASFSLLTLLCSP